jgi:hypothetical protein
MFVGTLIYTISEGENPLTHPLFWILGVLIAIHLVRKFLWENRASAVAPRASSDSFSIAPSPDAAPLVSEVDMFTGLRGWKEGDSPAGVAMAVCSLSGREESYLRCLLVTAALRDDEPGRIVAAAARQLLRPSADPTDSEVAMPAS